MKKYIDLLCNMIETPSISKYEEQVADLIFLFIRQENIIPERFNNNIICKNRYFDCNKPTILLNSHIDTVKAAENWTYNPFQATIETNKIIGLGSNDAGASLITLLAVFIHYYEHKNLRYNLIFIASAEEEISGENGIASIIHKLGNIKLAIVGEPTNMQMAIAEKGLMVLDCTVHGVAGHAARNEGINALYKAIDDINILRNYKFERISSFLGELKISITQITSGYQHNVVPDICKFVVDVRTNELYNNKEVFDIINNLVNCDVVARSTRLNSSQISIEHPIVQRGLELGLKIYGSPTMSDQALMPFTSIKIGPGDSSRSHTANEYVLISEIEQGFEIYLKLLHKLELSE